MLPERRKSKGLKGLPGSGSGAAFLSGAPLDRSFSGQLFSSSPGLQALSFPGTMNWTSGWTDSCSKQSEGYPVSSLALAEQLEAADPRLLVTWVPLAVEQGHNLGLGVGPALIRLEGRHLHLDFNQVALDPVNGEMRGKRMWGELSLSRENLLPFLYKLHYSMHLPDGFGIEFGIWFMGILAIVWTIDCFIALSISFPSASAWSKSFGFRWRQGGAKLNFDLHRSGGVWVWGILLILAVTAISMNLKQEIMRPLVSVFSPLTPSPFTRTPNPPELPIAPIVSRQAILELAAAEAKALGWSSPPGGHFRFDPSSEFMV